MSKGSGKVRPCKTCKPTPTAKKGHFARDRGFTRHVNGICSKCRREAE